MKNICKPGFVLSAIFGALTFATPASAQDTGIATFIAGSATYAGRYSIAEKLLSVDIDGMQYRGNFDKTIAVNDEKLTDEPASGNWGSAFLFASSAKILQCTLDSGFPGLRGSCTSADGRYFRVEAQSPS